MILGRGQRDDRPAVGDRQHADFLPVEPLLDHDLVAGFAELLVAADPFDRLDRFGPRGADEHALAAGQSVGLDHHRHVLAILQIGGGVVGVAKHVVIGGRHVGIAQQVLAEDLASFQLGGLLARAKDPQLGILKGIDNALGQRQLRTDDGQPDVILLGELDQPRKVGRRDVDIFGLDAPCRHCRARQTSVRREGFARSSRPARVHGHHCQ